MEASSSIQYLYHLTSLDALDSILDRGIDPGYWGTLAVVRYYARVKLHVGDPLVFRVPFTRFDPKQLGPDLRGVQDPPPGSVTEMTEDEIEEEWAVSNQTWEDSLRIIGSVTYRHSVDVTVKDIIWLHHLPPE